MEADTLSPLQYIARELSFIDNRMVQAGEPVSYAGMPADNLEPTCDEGYARQKQHRADQARRAAAAQVVPVAAAAPDLSQLLAMVAGLQQQVEALKANQSKPARGRTHADEPAA